jgi:hypothetical protein
MNAWFLIFGRNELGCSIHPTVGIDPTAATAYKINNFVC